MVVAAVSLQCDDEEDVFRWWWWLYRYSHHHHSTPNGWMIFAEEARLFAFIFQQVTWHDRRRPHLDAKTSTFELLLSRVTTKAEVGRWPSVTRSRLPNTFHRRPKGMAGRDWVLSSTTHKLEKSQWKCIHCKDTSQPSLPRPLIRYHVIFLTICFLPSSWFSWYGCYLPSVK